MILYDYLKQRMPAGVDLHDGWQSPDENRTFNAYVLERHGTFASIDIDEIYKVGIEHKSNLTIVKGIDGIFAITPEKGIRRLVDPKQVIGLIELRKSDRHYRTEQNDVDSIETLMTDSFKQNIGLFEKKGLFLLYYEGSEKQFGFYAERTGSESFLITARGSNKKNIDTRDIVHVDKVDHKKRIIYCTSEGKKASLNANVASVMFRNFPELNHILHSHIDMPFEKETRFDYSPGTKEDIEEIMKTLAGEAGPVRLKNHGIVVPGNRIGDIFNHIRGAGE
ncbi:hypothetical protein COV93_06700 [Candidatus Woesearchaeota archaeon CG11_big_fil_rev_8_21_14_0_20_43_8]|nr:MAG: hypothetical protein COV93_06700 [Candidatus Woesearchaeota archaeon CG11_big_fil_rev_8_21_14_0_20_43_8]